jgi:protein subunit release factor A
MKQLILSITKKDFRIDTFRSGGSGGQHQNTTDSGVRIVHIESGAVGESRTERSQLHNKKLAFNRLVKSPKFKIWLNRKLYEISESKTIEEIVDESMHNSNLKIECRDKDNKWINYETGCYN